MPPSSAGRIRQKEPGRFADVGGDGAADDTADETADDTADDTVDDVAGAAVLVAKSRLFRRDDALPRAATDDRPATACDEMLHAVSAASITAATMTRDISRTPVGKSPVVRVEQSFPGYVAPTPNGV